MSKTILVTGAAGFIGRHLVNSLLKQGHQVIALLRSSSAVAAGREAEIAANFQIPQGCEDSLAIERLNLVPTLGEENPQWLSRTMLDRGGPFGSIHAIVHLAAVVDTLAGLSWQLYQQNLGSTLGMLQLARRLNVKRIVYGSTLAVRGEMHNECSHPCGCHSQHPISAYAASKRAGEDACVAWAADRRGTVELSLARMGSVYGPGAGPKNLVSWLLREFCGGLGVETEGPLMIPEIQRDLVYVGDVAELLAYSAIEAGGPPRQTLHFAPGRPRYLSNLAERIRVRVGSNRAWAEFTPPDNVPRQLYARPAAKYKWTELQRGLATTFRDYRQEADYGPSDIDGKI